MVTFVTNVLLLFFVLQLHMLFKEFLFLLKHGRDKHSKAKGRRNSSNLVRDDTNDFIDGDLGLACAKLVSPVWFRC